MLPPLSMASSRRPLKPPEPARPLEAPRAAEFFELRFNLDAVCSRTAGRSAVGCLDFRIHPRMSMTRNRETCPNPCRYRTSHHSDGSRLHPSTKMARPRNSAMPTTWEGSSRIGQGMCRANMHDRFVIVLDCLGLRRRQGDKKQQCTEQQPNHDVSSRWLRKYTHIGRTRASPVIAQQPGSA